MQIDEKTLKGLKKRFEYEVNKREMEVVEYWRREIEQIYKKRYDNMGSMQMDIKNLMERMANRVSILLSITRDGP